jgi:hypothetical protein
MQMKTDNTTATGYINGTIKQKRSKAMDMLFYWIKDRVKKASLKFTRAQGFRIWQIISQNIICRRIINEYEMYTFMLTNNR